VREASGSDGGAEVVDDRSVAEEAGEAGRERHALSRVAHGCKDKYRGLSAPRCALRSR
jgi:hypothetical protein